MTKLEESLRAAADDPMWPSHAEVSKALLLRAAEAVKALQMMEHAYGSFANTPKTNRCYPTARERNTYERQAMSAARAALA
ncbi:MAG TPA: hypothetical protein VIN03_11830 [Roseateles sp.]